MADDSLQIANISEGEDAPLTRQHYPSPSGAHTPYSYNYGYTTLDDEGMHLRDMWRLLRKRKWLVISMTFVVTTIVAIQMYRTPSTYQAYTVVEVEKGTPTATKAGELIVQDSDLDAIKTKMLTVKSQPVLEDVVRTLRLDRSPRFLKKDEAKPLGQTLNELVHRRAMQPVADLEESDPTQPADGAEQDPVRLADQQDGPDRTTLESYAAKLDNALTVDLIHDTRAIKISYTHTDPEMAATVTNQIAKSFMGVNFKTQTEKFTDTSDWLDRSTRELKTKVEKAEQALADYTREHHIFSTDGKETLTTEKLSRLHDQLTRAETDRLLKQSLYEELKAGHISQLPETYVDARLTNLRVKLADLQTQAGELSVKYGPRNPKVIEVNQEITITQQQIEEGMQALQEKLKGEYDRALQDEKTLNAALEQSKMAAEKENQDAIQFSILRQEVDTAKSLYTDFLQKTNQANLQVAEQHSNMHVIQPALVPKKPVAPKRTVAVLIGFLLSLASGIGLVFFIEYLDNSVKSVEDVSRYIQLPALGIIPAISSGSGKGLLGTGKANKRALENGASSRTLIQANRTGIMDRLANFENHSSAAEAYRALRTSVLLSAAGSPPKTLLVTSGQAGEGKTTTCVNTAMSLAQLGAEVLVIDADLRKPTVHKVFGADPSLGLSTYLSRNVEIDRVIQRLQIPHMSILPCGPIPPNPAELISSEKMRDLLRQLCDRYDHILIDSPPLVNVTDPVILSTMVNGVMLVVCWGKSSRDVARRVRSELSSVGAKILGVVLNNVDLRSEGYSDYYYYRYYASYGEGRQAVNGN